MNSIDIEHHDDRSVTAHLNTSTKEVVVRYVRERRTRVRDEQTKKMVYKTIKEPVEEKHTLTTLDGRTWQKDEIALRQRFEHEMQARKNLRPKNEKYRFEDINFKRKKVSELTEHLTVPTDVTQAVEAPVILPVIHHGEPLHGRAKGKKRTKKNPKDSREVKRTPLQAAHYHRCHGRKFICKCDRPWEKRLCGTTKCLIGLS